ncbi:MAG TPA: FAD/NAD(P)-binding protein, partial [Gemmatimonadaceae bacterium]
HLQRHHGPAPLHIIQINRSGRIARGVAYGTRSSEHVLNVPAGRMSASLLKGKYWEATAVPELRVHAARVAARILSVVGRERTPAVA